MHKPSQLLIIIACSLLSLSSFAEVNLNKEIANVSQNALTYTNPKIANQPLITSEQQQKLSHQYLTRYFAPWHKPFLLQSFSFIKQQEQEMIDSFAKRSGYSQGRQKHTQEWVKTIATNMNLAKMPNLNMRGITLRLADVRAIPTSDNSFEKWDKPGQGYPFDNIEESTINPNTPVYVLGTSKNGRWYLIISPVVYGWVRSQDVAFVSKNFIKHWQTGQYVVPTTDRLAMYDDQDHFRFDTRIGSLLPMTKMGNENYEVQLAVTNDQGYAKIIPAYLHKTHGTPFPMEATENNIAKLANATIGQPYGWGGMNTYRDCSQTTMNLFASLGIWLPRNSADQAHADNNLINLANYSDTDKLKMIKLYAKPFRTLIWLKGHIMLYLGEKDGQLFVYQDVWGLHTESFFGHEGRAVLGRTVITPITLGQDHITIPSSFIHSVQGLRILG